MSMVSRLQWTRASPAAFSFARSASPTSPNDPQQARDVSARMRRIAAQSALTSSLQKLLNRLYKTDLPPEKDALEVIAPIGGTTHAHSKGREPDVRTADL